LTGWSDAIQPSCGPVDYRKIVCPTRRVQGRSVDERDCDDGAWDGDINNTATSVGNDALSRSRLQHAESKLERNVAGDHKYGCCDKRERYVKPAGSCRSSIESEKKVFDPSICTTRPPPTRSESQFAWLNGFQHGCQRLSSFFPRA
jgi:hypothetical protein